MSKPKRLDTTDNRHLNIILSQKQHQQLEHLAVQRKLSKTEIIRQSLERYFDDEILKETETKDRINNIEMEINNIKAMLLELRIMLGKGEKQYE